MSIVNVYQFASVLFWVWGLEVGFDCISSWSLPFLLLYLLHNDCLKQNLVEFKFSKSACTYNIKLTGDWQCQPDYIFLYSLIYGCKSDLTLYENEYIVETLRMSGHSIVVHWEINEITSITTEKQEMLQYETNAPNAP